MSMMSRKDFREGGKDIMANRNFNGVQINQSSTIVEQAGEKIKDCRNRFMVYNANGNVALAVDGTKPIVGVALIESGLIYCVTTGAGSLRMEKSIRQCCQSIRRATHVRWIR